MIDFRIRRCWVALWLATSVHWIGATTTISTSAVADFPQSGDLDAPSGNDPRTGVLQEIRHTFAWESGDGKWSVLTEGIGRWQAGPYVLGASRREGLPANKLEYFAGVPLEAEWSEDSAFTKFLGLSRLEAEYSSESYRVRLGRILIQLSRQRLLDPFSFTTSPRPPQWGRSAESGISAGDFEMGFGTLRAGLIARVPRHARADEASILVRLRDGVHGNWSLIAGSNQMDGLLGATSSFGLGTGSCDASIALLRDEADGTWRPKTAVALSSAGMALNFPWNGWIEGFFQDRDFLPNHPSQTDRVDWTDKEYLSQPFRAGLASALEIEVHPLLKAVAGSVLDIENHSGYFVTRSSWDCIALARMSGMVALWGQIPLEGSASPLGGYQTPSGRIRTVSMVWGADLDLTF